MSNEKDIEFEIAGTKFRGSYLPVEKALRGFSILSPAISKIFGQLDPELAREGGEMRQEAAFKALSDVLSSFQQLPAFRPLFLAHYEVFLSENDMSGFFPLKDFEDNAFRGKPALYVGFLVTAIAKEYGDFLRENGLSMAVTMAGNFGLRLTSKKNGSSGDSSSTKE